MAFSRAGSVEEVQKTFCATRLNPQARVLDDLSFVCTICRCISDSSLVNPETTQSLYSLQVPLVSRQWSKFLAPLLRISRTFQRACLPLLWNSLDTLEPLFVVLGGEKTITNHVETSWAFPDGIPPARWNRLLVYSQNIEALILGHGHTLEVHWIAFLSSTVPSLVPWFSGVKRIYLTSSDAFPIFLATSLMPHVRTVNLGLRSQLHSDLAILGAARTNENLVGVRVEHLTSLQTLRVVSQLTALKYLYIRIPANTPASLLVDSVNNLQALRSLTIMQTDPEVEVENPLRTLDGYNAAISRPSLFPHLHWIAINASAITQCVVAAYLAPTTLESLDMCVLSNRGAVYLGPVIAVYAQRNPALLWLKVEVGMSDTPGLPEDVLSLRDNPIFDTHRFLEALTTPEMLSGLLIDGVPYFDQYIVEQVLRTIRGLVHIECLQFLPLPVTTLSEDRLVPGTLSDLKKMANYNPHVLSVETLLDVSNVPALRSKYDSTHRLGKLSIWTNGNPPQAVRHRLEVAKFIDALFPSLQKLSSPIRDIEDGAESVIWAEVQEMVFSNQMIRAGLWSAMSGEGESNEKRVRFAAP